MSRNKARIANAIETAIRIDTLPIAANICVLFALVAVFTGIGLWIAASTWGAFTGEATRGVDTLAAATQTRDGFTLVDIWK